MGMTFEKKEEGRYVLNVNGYVCPHPQIYTKKALEKLGSGDFLELIFDNPSSGESIEAMIENDGNELVEKKTESGQFEWLIQKA
ncbi:MAG: sulfurtransferase TusA family protein [Gammaproteobacteria bacterium]|nr:sulfurtransferase TusA family protein [Gammaproteobacteria bacterium]MDH3559420.1 sulfurtransferase TusA family protein [Gammaproteobacteria bacterium]